MRYSQKKTGRCAMSAIKLLMAKSLICEETSEQPLDRVEQQYFCCQLTLRHQSIFFSAHHIKSQTSKNTIDLHLVLKISDFPPLATGE